MPLRSFRHSNRLARHTYTRAMAFNNKSAILTASRLVANNTAHKSWCWKDALLESCNVVHDWWRGRWGITSNGVVLTSVITAVVTLQRLTHSIYIYIILPRRKKWSQVSGWNIFKVLKQQIFLHRESLSLENIPSMILCVFRKQIQLWILYR